jgi:uncharacterized protein (DUF2141 family)
MKTLLYACVLISLVACAASVPSFASEAGTGAVVVRVAGIKADQGGNLIVMLFRGADGWLDVERAFLRKVAKVDADSATVTFDGVPYDSTYAVEVIHDKNGNGTLDMRKFPYPKPKEGAGVSNNTFRLGPPAYDKARFEVAAPSVSLGVVMRY